MDNALWIRRSGLLVSITASHGNGPGLIPGPGIVHLWICVLLNEVTPRRSDGTLNRGLVCVTHQAWTIKIPTSLRKRIVIAGAYRLHTPPSEVGVEPAVQSAVREVKTGSHAAPETMGNAERESL